MKTHTVAQPFREIVVRSSSGDVDLVTAGKQIEVRETQHYVFEKPTLHQDVKNGVLTLDTDCHGLGPRGDYAVGAGTDSGDVTIDGITRNDRAQKSIQARTDSGDITLRGR